MDKNANPYVFDRPITTQELFFGRDDILRVIKEALMDREQDNLIILYGQRRMGKTSLLHQVGPYLGELYLPILIDLQQLPSDSPESFLWEVASVIQRALQGDRDLRVELPSQEPFLADAWHAFGHQFLARVSEALGDRHLLLMFDEAHLISEVPWPGDIWSYLLGLTRQHPRLGLILALESREPPSPAAAGVQQKIGYLNREEAVRLIVQPTQGTLTYEPEAVERLFSLTSGHPYYLQLLCHTLFAYCQRVNVRTVTPTDVETVLPEAVERAGPDCQFLWDSSTPEEKFVLAALAQAGGKERQAIAKDELLTTLKRRKAPLSARQVAKALVNLSLREIINFQAPYTFQVDVFRLWVRDQKRIGGVKRELAGTVKQWQKEKVGVPVERRKPGWRIGLAALLVGMLLVGGYLGGFFFQPRTEIWGRMRATPTVLAPAPPSTPPADTPTAGPGIPFTPPPTPTYTPTPLPTPTATLAPTAPARPGPLLSLPERRSVLAVAIAPSDGRWVYVALKGAGIYRSTDGGLSWALTALNGSGQDILIDPADPRRVFVAVWAGVLRSADGGATWDMARDGLPKDQQVSALAWDSSDRRVMYAGLRASPSAGSAVYRSTDGGETWERLWSPAGREALGSDVAALAVDPTGGTRYVALSNAYDPRLDLEGEPCLPCAACEPGRVGGEVWRICRHGRDLVLDPQNPQVVYFARGAGTVRSTDGGETWWDLTAGRPCLGEEVAHAGSWALAIAPRDSQVLYEGTGSNSLTFQAGLYKTTDGGQSWVVINNGLPGQPGPCPSFLSTTVEHIYALAVDPADSRIVYAATSAGLYKTTDGGESWNRE